MIAPEDDDEKVKAARAIADMISEYRKECIEAMRNTVVKECDEVVDSGYDPSRGRGRGPWWADGG